VDFNSIEKLPQRKLCVLAFLSTQSASAGFPVTDFSSDNAVNQHYLNKVIDLSEEMRVEASEDIFDARGNKLLAKGAQVSRALQERLIVHKLKKPLEACIVVEGGVDGRSVMRSAERALDTSAAIKHVLTATQVGGVSPVSLLSQLSFGSALSMMLTIADREGGGALDHAVTVSLLSIAIARKAKLSQTDQACAGLAGLLHDIGELYIDPAFLVKGNRLLPHEWGHIVVHPHTGMMLINQLESYPQGVGRAVAEHHERNDGSGYPRRLAGSTISAAGHVVSIAETVAGVIMKDHPLERADLALKIIPGEYAREYVSAISGALRGHVFDVHEHDDRSYGVGAEDVSRLLTRIDTALKAIHDLLNAPGPKSPRAIELLTATALRIRQIQRAAVSTGLDIPLGLDEAKLSAQDLGLMFERDVATREIQWHVRDAGRDLALQGAQQADRLLLTPLVNLLDDDYSQAPQVMQLLKVPAGAGLNPTLAAA
jgi:HD-GYP domain-containing protein (c-di-GMP phosphodiesterase class II)